MVAHAQANEYESKLTFAQTPPGLSGAIVRREALADVLDCRVPFGLLLSYRPELAQADPINRAACLAPPWSWHAAPYRRRRSRDLLRRSPIWAKMRTRRGYARGRRRDMTVPAHCPSRSSGTTGGPATALDPASRGPPRRPTGPLARLAAELAE
jgi:hypothetical protein